MKAPAVVAARTYVIAWWLRFTRHSPDRALAIWSVTPKNYCAQSSCPTCITRRRSQ